MANIFQFTMTKHTCMIKNRHLFLAYKHINFQPHILGGKKGTEVRRWEGNGDQRLFLFIIELKTL